MLSGIRTQSGQTKINDEPRKNFSLRVRYTTGLKLIYAQPWQYNKNINSH